MQVHSLANISFRCFHADGVALHHGKLMPHVFISYVRENREIVDRLATELKRRGVIVWLDRNDIEPGARWREAIKNAIRSGKFFLACFSMEYNKRIKSYMNEEMTLAIDELRESRNPVAAN
jgi:hypothetical protein